MSTDPTARARRVRIAALAAGGVVVLLGATYVAAYAAAGDSVPRSATVAGVSIGGQGHDQAVRTLEEKLGPRATVPVTLTAGDFTVAVAPAEAGLSVDYAATVTATGTGRSWAPGHIWKVLIGGGPTAPVLVVDRAAMDRTTAQVADGGQLDPRNATLAYDDKAQAQIEPGVPGRTIAPAAVEHALTGAFPGTDAAPLDTESIDPEITTEKAEQVRRDWADPAVSGPVTVNAGDAGSFQVTPAMIASSTSFEVQDGNLAPRIDAKRLETATKPAMKQLKGVQEGQDATWQLGSGKPTIVPSKDGRGIARDDLVKALQPVLTTQGDQRRVSVAVTAVPASFTTADAQKADVAGVIGQFTTYFPHADYRNTNLGLVASKINGYVVLPGETFSLNDVVGRRDAASGFADGWVIQGDREVKEVGGGVSQSATTIFNAAFAAGLQDVEHHPHSLWFDRYPPGREATVYYGSLDLRFRNDTDHVVVIEAHRVASTPGTQGSLTVKLWGASPYDKVVTPDPVKSAFVTPGSKTMSGPDCTPQPAFQGFTATFYRAFIKNGVEVKRQNYTWKYSAGDEIKCS
ncbi:VanW family protein [Raineyella sp. W15-4]|uniref:VanW family protein n=1 Tax=Raineyella sp. W15-4 TaxID=3081651 RepID=UPI0029556DE4|nr:VanW family protein [Raineyella sp. W15-4]WOQ15963.1 VanW family protein [Raineyella sp. W15-4]